MFSPLRLLVACNQRTWIWTSGTWAKVAQRAYQPKYNNSKLEASLTSPVQCFLLRSHNTLLKNSINNPRDFPRCFLVVGRVRLGVYGSRATYTFGCIWKSSDVLRTSRVSRIPWKRLLPQPSRLLPKKCWPVFAQRWNSFFWLGQWGVMC